MCGIVLGLVAPMRHRSKRYAALLMVVRWYTYSLRQAPASMARASLQVPKGADEGGAAGERGRRGEGAFGGKAEARAGKMGEKWRGAGHTRPFSMSRSVCPIATRRRKQPALRAPAEISPLQASSRENQPRALRLVRRPRKTAATPAAAPRKSARCSAFRGRETPPSPLVREENSRLASPVMLRVYPARSPKSNKYL
jgi:hypothetical protein